MPAIAIAILLAGGCLAAVLNRFWMAGAQEELRSAGSAAALAAAQTLVGDDLLKTNADREAQTELARKQVILLGGSYSRDNEAAPVLTPRFGKVVLNPETGEQKFLETDRNPTSVQISAARDNEHRNGVQMFAPYLTGQTHADVVAVSEASLTNLVMGVRPIGNAGVPAWPLGVLEFSEDPRIPSWTTHIDGKLGGDRYGWDAAAGKLIEKADGLPEIVLRPQGDQTIGNVMLVDLGRGLKPKTLESQFLNGWKADDLERLGGEFTLAKGVIEMPCSDDVAQAEKWLSAQIGEPRLFVLYSPTKKVDAISATQLVGGRILKVEQPEGKLEITLQPAVIGTRMAVLDEEALWAGKTRGNPYLYKISLTQ